MKIVDRECKPVPDELALTVRSGKVEFETVEQAEAAKEALDGADFQGNKIKVELYKRKGRQPRKARKDAEEDTDDQKQAGSRRRPRRRAQDSDSEKKGRRRRRERKEPEQTKVSNPECFLHIGNVRHKQT